MTFTLPALLLGLAAFAVQDPEPPKPKAKAPAAVSPDKKRTATAKKEAVEVKDNKTGKVVLSIRGHKEDVVSLGFSPDGRHLASADKGGVINVFDVATGKALWRHATGVKGDGKLAFSPDGKNLTYAVDKNARTLDAATGKLLQ